MIFSLTDYLMSLFSFHHYSAIDAPSNGLALFSPTHLNLAFAHRTQLTVAMSLRSCDFNFENFIQSLLGKEILLLEFITFISSRGVISFLFYDHSKLFVNL